MQLFPSFKNIARAGFCLLTGLALLQNTSHAQSAEKFFPKKDLMPIGSYYYPEQWPKEQWGRDMKKLSELGFDLDRKSVV